MNAVQLQRLLREPESATLEFKRSWYAISGSDAGKTRVDDEMIKDVLSLANGSLATAGEVAYLVVGVSDTRDSDGARELVDVGDLDPERTRRQVLQKVSAACEPTLPDVGFEVLDSGGTRVGVLTVPPSPHVHETTRELKPSNGRHYTERSVFIRSGETVRIASAQEREALSTRKRHRFKEYRRVSPVWYGASIGALLGAMAGVMLGDYRGGNSVARFAGLVVGAVMFGLAGIGFGYATQQVLDVRRDWDRMHVILRWTFILIFVAGVVWTGLALYAQVKG